MGKGAVHRDWDSSDIWKRVEDGKRSGELVLLLGCGFLGYASGNWLAAECRERG
jgi:hypothetical protein